MRRGPRFWELWVLPCLTHLPIFSYFLGSPRSIHLYSGFQILFFILNSILDHFGPYFDIWSPLKSHIFLMKPPWLYLKSLVLSPDPTINPWQWPLAATPPHELFIFGFQLLGKTIRTAVCIWITVNHVYVYISLHIYIISILYSAHRERGWCADSNVVSSCHIYCQFIYHSEKTISFGLHGIDNFDLPQSQSLWLVTSPVAMVRWGPEPVRTWHSWRVRS